MESSSSRLSPSSWKRQQAWANQYCTRHSTAIEEETSNSCQETPELQPAFLEEAFLQAGNSSSTIENWLEQCNSSGDPFMDSLSAQGASGPCSNRTSFEDDLSLGAEAILLLDKDTDISSISEVLERCEVDAETVLSNLGFIQEETPAASWIPARFFAIPSQAQGIDFQLFLKAQVQRLEMEDPYLMLASRFKQVQTLAITANAFFCLYSYVSKTPVQKISPALLFSAFPDIPDSWNTPSKQETESPLQRLKKAISRMCLYTLPSSKKQPPMSRLEQIAWEVIDLARKNRLYCDVENRKEEPPMVHSGGPSLQARRSASSMSTATSTTSSCFYFKASSQSGQKTEFPQALSLCRLSHCTRETSIGETGHIGYQEQYCYGRHSPKKASSPEESSDESEGN
ncbi:protein TESPA1 isoform X2 [Eublepharis macularius]|uniref:Protein TESPA1 isoform X2 n=1 Tax=Eublepharis macularius TaxID=481883 RepID=A0AA97KR91_EUBMA|nr:protein TESPA1 isoform X2 [Eublepharis macularius]